MVWSSRKRQAYRAARVLRVNRRAFLGGLQQPFILQIGGNLANKRH